MEGEIKQKETPIKQYSPRPPSILINKKELTSDDIISFFNKNIIKIFVETISIIFLISFLVFYANLRKTKNEEIQKLKNSPDQRQISCQKNYEENGCDKINESEKFPPLLKEMCENFDKCRHEKSAIPSVPELAIAHCGSLVQVFINELSTKTIITIFIILSINILVDTLRNRPKIVI